MIYYKRSFDSEKLGYIDVAGEWRPWILKDPPLDGPTHEVPQARQQQITKSRSTSSTTSRSTTTTKSKSTHNKQRRSLIWSRSHRRHPRLVVPMLVWPPVAIKKWRRVDSHAIRYRTSNSAGPMWSDVVRRTTNYYQELGVWRGDRGPAVPWR